MNPTDAYTRVFKAFQHDPLGFVTTVYGPIELRTWQVEFLKDLRERLINGQSASDLIFRLATASGHGVGKSTMCSWLGQWAVATFPEARGIITANTEKQLMTKTWPEYSKWFHRSPLLNQMFELTATAMFFKHKRFQKTWRMDMIPWSENKPESFQGLHNQGKRLIALFDECSTISDKIWEATDGALTDEDTEIFWAVFGNPTRNTGRFRECWGKFQHRWVKRNIDSRTVEGTNKEYFEQIVNDWGEDSDYARVRVRGLFPQASSLQFIPSDVVSNAMTKEATSNLGDPLIMTLDIARGGDDNCVFGFRRGLDARSIPWVVIPGSEVSDSMRLVSKAGELHEEYKPDAFFYDGVGVGGAVGDRLKQLGIRMIEVKGSLRSPSVSQSNMIGYCWQRGKEWLMSGGAIPNDPFLELDLTSREYDHNSSDQFRIEKKIDMKKRGLASPDRGDALMMGFAYPVSVVGGYGFNAKRKGHRAITEYDENELLLPGGMA